MPRIITKQAAVARPAFFWSRGIGTSWGSFFDVPDYSVPDPNQNWPERDPLDFNRRIEPGMIMLETPLLAHNRSGSPVLFEARCFAENSGIGVINLSVEIPPGDTYHYPLPGQRFMKADPDSANGDQLQVRASVADAIDVAVWGSIGSAEQDQPA